MRGRRRRRGEKFRKLLTEQQELAMSSDDEGGEEYLFKIITIGDSAVGKSNILSHYARNEFNPTPRPPLASSSRPRAWAREEGQGPNLGHRRPGALLCRHIRYYHGTVGALVMYDISRCTTFENVGRWLDELKRNKCDLGNIRDVCIEEGKSLAESEGLFFYGDISP